MSDEAFSWTAAPGGRPEERTAEFRGKRAAVYRHPSGRGYAMETDGGEVTDVGADTLSEALALAEGMLRAKPREGDGSWHNDEGRQ